MKILVYPHDLGIGGSQLNAIEIAAAVRDLGHDVTIFGRPGVLNERIRELALGFIEAPPPGRRPSYAAAKALTEVVRERGIDVIHGYEWPPTLDAVLATRTGAKARVVSTVMSMSVPPFIPRSVALVVGTEQIAKHECRIGRSRVSVIEPPVDLGHNDVAADPGTRTFSDVFGLDDSRLNVISVTRFARELKLEGILTAIDVVGALAADAPVRLVLVGDGPARDVVEGRANAVNEALGEHVVVLTGRIDDPRAAYASADVALGMGGSALRALAYEKPVIVQGERGFWRTLTPVSVGSFLRNGWYGVGDDPSRGASNLRAELEALLASPTLRAELGRFGLHLVRDRFSLRRAAQIQEDVYRQTLEGKSETTAAADLTALVRYSRYYVAKRARRVAGREQTDDFNARPVLQRERVR